MKVGAHTALAAKLAPMLADAPGDIALQLKERTAATLALIERAGAREGDERAARTAATALYHVTAASLFLDEARRLSDPRRADLARLLLAYKLLPRDPVSASVPEHEAAGDRVIDALVAARVRVTAQA